MLLPHFLTPDRCECCGKHHRYYHLCQRCIRRICSDCTAHDFFSTATICRDCDCGHPKTLGLFSYVAILLLLFSLIALAWVAVYETIQIERRSAMHENSRLIFDRYAAGYIDPSMHVLEIGPDKPRSTFMEMLGHPLQRWTTADICAAVRADYTLVEAYDVPPAWLKTFDVGFSANVLEHVADPERFLISLCQMIRPGGRVITIMPVSWPYHEAPIDCQRYQPDGLRALYERVGLRVEVCEVASLENVGAGTRVPGRALTHITEPELAKAYKRAMIEGGPIECAFDLVCVGSRPSV